MRLGMLLLGGLAVWPAWADDEEVTEKDLQEWQGAALSTAQDTTNDLFSLASELFQELNAEAQGDPEKLAELLAEAEKNPEKFAARLSPEQRKRLEALTEKLKTP